MKGVQFLDEYYFNPGKYLPLSSRVNGTYPPRDPEFGDVNIGWNCGLIEPNRPYFSMLWATDGITMLTILITAEGLEGWPEERVEELCEQNKVYRKLPNGLKTAIVPVIDDTGDLFLSINVIVGIEDKVYVDDTSKSYPYSRLHDYNRKRASANAAPD